MLTLIMSAMHIASPSPNEFPEIRIIDQSVLLIQQIINNSFLMHYKIPQFSNYILYIGQTQYNDIPT